MKTTALAVVVAIGVFAMASESQVVSSTENVPAISNDSACNTLAEQEFRQLSLGRLEDAKRLAVTPMPTASESDVRCSSLLLNNLAAGLLALGRREEAEIYARQALEQIARAFQSTDPLNLTSLNIVMSSRLGRGKTAEARQTLRVIEAIQTTTATEHALVRWSEGSVFYAEGKKKQAESAYLAALSETEHTQGGPILERVAISLELGALYFSEGRYSEALTIATRALSLSETAEGELFPLDKMRILQMRGVSHARMGHWREAKDDLSKALLSVQTVSNADPAELEVMATNYALALRKVHRKQEAKLMEAWAANLHDQKPGADAVVSLAELMSRNSKR